MRILLEASTESEWVAQHLETLGHEVIVADPTFAPMYSERSRRVKTDRRDVAALAEACHRGMLSRGASAIGGAAHGAGAAQCPSRTDGQSDPGDLAGAGDHARSRAPDSERQHRELPRPAWRRWTSRRRSTETLAPLQRVIAVLNDELATADDRFATHRGRRTPSSPG